MSVINKMLRDLDANKQQPESNYTQNTGEGARPTGIIASQSPRQVRLSSVILVGSIIIVLGVAIGVAWWLGLAMGKQNAATTPVSMVSNDSGGAVVAVTQTPVSASMEQEEQEKLADKNVLLATKSDENTVSTEQLTAHSQIQPTAQLEVQPTVELAEQSTAQPSVLKPPPDEQLLAEEQQLAEVKQQEEPKEPLATPPSMQITVASKSNDELAQDAYVKGNVAYQRGEVNEAVAAYQKALELKPELHDARAQWVALLFAKQEVNRALALLQQGMNLFPQHTPYRLLAARIWQDQQQPSRALDVLLTSPPTERIQEYLQLQAALAQQTQRWQVALESWQTLLQQYGLDVRGLLGSAIALDNLARFDEAKMYYLQAREQGGLSQQSQNFIAQRLRQLEGI